MAVMYTSTVSVANKIGCGRTGACSRTRQSCRHITLQLVYAVLVYYGMASVL